MATTTGHISRPVPLVAGRALERRLLAGGDLMRLVGFQSTYAFVLEWLCLLTPTHCSVPKFSVDTVMATSEPPRLSIRVAGAHDAAAAKCAEGFADVVYQRLVLPFRDRIERAEPPALIESALFTTGGW